MGFCDLHLHTSASDGRDSPDDMVAWVARHTDLDAIAITDHDTITGALRAAEVAGRLPSGPDVIVGEEVSTLDGHVIGLFRLF